MISVSLNRGLNAATGVIIGILAVNILFFTLSALGVGAVIASSPALALGLKIVGCGYLAWVAFQTICEVYANWKSGDALTIEREASTRTLWQGFLKGFIIQASSIKNIMIFVAIIPQFVNSANAILPQMLALGIVSVVVEAPILFAYGFAAYRLSRMMNHRTANILDLVSAALLIVVAGSVAII